MRAASHAFNGADLGGGFESQTVDFNNLFTDFGAGCCWSGWSYSNTADTTTPGATNQYSAIVGNGANGSANFGVAFDGIAGGGGVRPIITLPQNSQPVSVMVTNTTYAALSMQQGDGFAKMFGGPSGNDPDWFRLHVAGWDEADSPVAEVVFYLADYRSSDNSEDYILADWIELDLTPLQGLNVAKLAIGFSSSDVGPFGINTPLYVAIDDLTVEVDSPPGDADLNGQVDGTDLDIWSASYGIAAGASVTQGDADEDDDVDAADFLTWQQNYLSGVPLALVVPEPATGSWAVLGLVLVIRHCEIHRRLNSSRPS